LAPNLVELDHDAASGGSTAPNGLLLLKCVIVRPVILRH
uniref:Copper-containing nitrite reductase n=1 Tax=Brugia timori TaxID=42155 RepID=A0A0R3Q5I1_9BILA